MEEVRGERCVLLKFGELALKGRNRPLFVNALERNLRRLTSDLGPLEVRHRGGVLIVTGDVPEDALVERCLALPGVSVVQPALRCERDAAAGADAAVALLRGRPGRTFAIRSRRRDKRFPLRSIELSRVIGDAVRVRLGLDVDLSNPDLEVFVEVDHKELLVSRRAAARRRRAAGRLERARARAALRRARLARRGLPDDEARPALRLRSLQRAAVHRPRVRLQGLRPRRPARPLPGRLAPVRGLVRHGPAPARDRRRRAPPGALAAAADGEGGLGARPARGRRGARDRATRSARSPRRRCRTSPWWRRRRSCRCCAR